MFSKGHLAGMVIAIPKDSDGSQSKFLPIRFMVREAKTVLEQHGYLH